MRRTVELNGAGRDELLRGEFRLVVDVAWTWRQILVNPHRSVGGEQRMAVHTGAADVDDPPHASGLGLVEQCGSGLDIHNPELPVGNEADVWSVQSCRMNHDLGGPDHGAAYLSVAEIADDARPSAGCSVNAANPPTGGIERLSYRVTDGS